MTAQVHTVHFGRTTPPEPALAFSLWRAGRDALRFHRTSAAADVPAAKLAEDMALACEWLREAGAEISLWRSAPTVDAAGVIRVFASRRRRSTTARLLDTAAARFGLVWFDADMEETSVPMTAGDAAEVSDALAAVGRSGEGWLSVESCDDHGAFVQVSLGAGDVLARAEAPATPGFGEALSRADKAQLKLLGWNEPARADDDAYSAELAFGDEALCATGAELLCRTLANVYGVSDGTPAILRVRVERAN